MVFHYLKDDPCIALLTVEKVTGSISVLHHVQQDSGGIGSNFKSKACTKGWESSATGLQLDEGIFSDSILTSYPKKEDLWAATSSDGFKGIEPELGVRGRNFSFRHVIHVPPFVVKTFSDSGHSAAEDLGLMVSGHSVAEDVRLMVTAAGK